jgi:hypothetical protein
MDAKELRTVLDSIETFIQADEGANTTALKQLWNMLSEAITKTEAKSKEEAGERYEVAIGIYENNIDIVMTHELREIFRTASGLAAFGKEGGG